MKKITSIIIAVFMLLSLAACSSGQTPAPETSPADGQDSINSQAPDAEGQDSTNSQAPDAEATEEDGQNPIMNFIGTYAADRCSILIEADGAKGAKVSVTWGSSAAENGEWNMSGDFDEDTLTINYSNCVKKDVVYNEGGSVDSETVEYENGTGSITFQEDGKLTLTWNDNQEQIADGTVFEYVS